MENEASKKKGKVLVGILVAIIVVLIGLVIYFAFIKNNNKNKNTNESNTSESNNKDDNTDNTNPDNGDSTKKDDNNDIKEDENEIISNVMKKVKKYYLFELTYGKTTKFNKDNITDIQLNNLETNMVAKNRDEWSDHFEDESEWSFTKNEADAFFKDVYGFIPTSYRDVICENDNEPLLVYKDNKFVWNDEHPGHGAYAVDYLDYDVLSVKKDGNLYTLDILFLYGNEEMGYYINGSEINEEFDYSSEDYDEQLSKFYKTYFSKHKNEHKNDAYQFTFAKVNGEYYLKSITL